MKIEVKECVEKLNFFINEEFFEAQDNDGEYLKHYKSKEAVKFLREQALELMTIASRIEFEDKHKND